MIKKTKTKHGMSYSPEYKTWTGMIDRCHNKKNAAYWRYGGRGIFVCERWKNSFINFYNDMGERPQGKTIDRINGNEGYAPQNCRWATKSEQSHNISSNIILTINGKSQIISDWARDAKVPVGRIQRRVSLGWSHYDAVFKKTEHTGKNTHNARKLTVNGHTKTISEWAKISRLSPATIRNRLNMGNSEKDAIRPKSDKPVECAQRIIAVLQEIETACDSNPINRNDFFKIRDTLKTWVDKKLGNDWINAQNKKNEICCNKFVEYEK